MTLPSEVERFQLRAELAFGAQPGGPQSEWVWTDVSDRLLSQDAAITAGRADEASQVQPATVPLVFDNPDGALTPDDPRSPHWPNVRRGTPLRLSLGEGTALLMPGDDPSFVQTVDHPSLDPSADIDVRVEVTSDDWTEFSLARKYVTTNDQRSWAFWVSQSTFPGQLRFAWSPDGTIGNRLVRSSTEAVAPPANGRLAVRVTVDVSPDIFVTFYTAPSIEGPWTQLGNQISTPGASSIFDSTSDVIVGVLGGEPPGIGGVPAMRGRLHGFELYDGIATDDNIIGYQRATLELDEPTGWDPGGSTTIARSTAQGLHGIASLSMTRTTGSGTGNIFAFTSPVTRFEVTAGQTFTAMAWFRAATNARDVHVIIQWWDADANFLDSISGATALDSSTAWTQRTVSGEAPTGAAFAVVIPQAQSVPADETHYVDQIGLFEGTPADWSVPPSTDPDFDAQPINTSSFVDEAGRTWTLEGNVQVAPTNSRFVGHVDEWAPSWPYGDISGPATEGEARVDVTAAGILRRLGQGAKPLHSTLFRHVTSQVESRGILAYWPFEDQRRALTAASPLPNVGPIITDNVDFAVDDSLDASRPTAAVAPGGTSPTSEDTASYIGQIPDPPAGFEDGWVLNFFFRIPTPGTDALPTQIMIVHADGTEQQYYITIDEVQIELFTREASSGTSTPPLVSRGTFPWDDRFTDWNLIHLELNQNGGNIDFKLNLVPLPPSLAAGAAFGISGSFAGTVGVPTIVEPIFISPPDGVSFAHLIIGPSANMQLGWLAEVDTAFRWEPAARRIQRLFGEEGIPIAIRGNPGVTTFTSDKRQDPGEPERMGPQRPRTLLELITECVEADLGILIERHDLVGFTYRTKETRYNQTPSLILDAGASEIALPYNPVLDDKALRNDVTVTREEGSSHREVDQPLIDAEGLYDEDVTINIEHDEQLANQAGWRLHLGTWPGMRYSSVTTELAAAPDRIADWEAVELGDRLQVTNLPPQHPTDAVDVLIEGYTERITPTRRTVTINASPAGPWEVGTLEEAGGPTQDTARLDTSGSELDVAVNATDTSLSVAITDGPLWVSDAAQLPFDIIVGGERMAVTAVTGAASPQTFTVTRSLNGVEKSHAVGTAVNVANPLVLAW